MFLYSQIYSKRITTDRTIPNKINIESAICGEKLKIQIQN